MGSREARAASQRSGCRQRKYHSPEQRVDTGTEKLGWDVLGDREEGSLAELLTGGTWELGKVWDEAQTSGLDT